MKWANEPLRTLPSQAYTALVQEGSDVFISSWSYFLKWRLGINRTRLCLVPWGHCTMQFVLRVVKVTKTKVVRAGFGTAGCLEQWEPGSCRPSPSDSWAFCSFWKTLLYRLKRIVYWFLKNLPFFFFFSLRLCGLGGPNQKYVRAVQRPTVHPPRPPLQAAAVPNLLLPV